MNYVDDFFSELNKELAHPLKIILTGAMAGMVLGCIRPSMDIDFEIEFSSMDEPRAINLQQVQATIDKVSKKLNLPAQYAENIQGWSQISFLDYRETSLSYKQFGKIEVRVLSPEIWTIGKMSRYIELDKMDVAFILKKRLISWEAIIAVWAKALKNSPLSDKSGEFKEHVLDFLQSEGKKIWGKSFVPAEAITQFKSQAGILQA